MKVSERPAGGRSRLRRKLLVGLGVAALVPPAVARGLAWHIRRQPDPDAGTEICGQMGEKGRYVESDDGTRLYVEEIGSGPAIVLCHGLFNSSEIWHFQKKELSATHHLICYDHRWHNRSDCPEDGLSLEALARDLAAVLDACLEPGEPVVLAGHSMGGMAILKYCEMFPADLGARIGGVALVDTAHVPMHEMMAGGALLRRLQKPLVEPAIRFAIEHPSLSDAVKSAVIRTSLFLVAVRYLGFGRGASLTQMEAIGEMARKTSISGAGRACLALLGSEEGISLDSLRGSGVPVLIWVGENDRLTAPGFSERIHRELPGSWLTVVPGVGHPSFMEAYRKFDLELQEFAEKSIHSRVKGDA